MDYGYGLTTARFLKTKQIQKTTPHLVKSFLREQSWIDQDAIAEAIEKSTVGEVDFASALSGTPISDDFTGALRPLEVFSRLGGREVGFFVKLLNAGTSGAIGYFIGNGRAIPVSRMALVGEFMQPAKVGALCVTTNEVLADTSAKAEARLSADLVAALAKAVDTALLDPANAGDTWTPASITNGVTPLNSAGATLANIDADLKRMLQELIDAGSNLLAAKWVMSPRSAVYLSMLRGTGGNLAFPDIGANGGRIAGLPAITTGDMPLVNSPAETSIVLLDSNDFIWSEDGAEVSLTSEGMIEMSDTPTGNTVTPTAATATPVSLFQEDATAIKAVRRVNWKMARPTISVLSGVDF